MHRLNQLSLIDETRLGFPLVAIYILLDSAYGNLLVSYEAHWDFITPPLPSLSPATIQISLLLIIASIITIVRVIRNRSHFNLQPVSAIDSILNEVSLQISQKIIGKNVHFEVTSNILDTNAFCLPIRHQSWIVLGGGIRRMLRSHPKMAQAIVAHECAHIKQGDAIFLTMAMYIFISYFYLTVIGFILRQVKLFASIPAAYESYIQEGSGIIGLLLNNIRNFLSSGFPGLISVLFAGIALLHFVRVREFRADELAAIAGFREDLTETLASQASQLKTSIRKKFHAFHPTVEERLIRLSAEPSWAKLDGSFVSSMAFFLTRIDDLLQQTRDDNPVLSSGADLNIALKIISKELLNTTFSIQLTIGVLIAYSIALHVYRVSATQYKLNATWEKRLCICFKLMAATFIGTFIASITSDAEIRRLILQYEGWNWEKSIDSALYAALLFSLLVSWLAISLIILTPRLQKKDIKSSIIRGFTFPLQGLLAAFLLQIGINAVGFILFELLGVHYPNFTISWLPYTTANFFKPGRPNLPQFALTIIISISCTCVLAHLIRKYLLGQITKKNPVHPSRLILL